MSYSNIYLQYIENRIEALEEDQDIGYDRESDDDFDDDEDLYNVSDEDRVFVEFTPIKITIDEPKGESLELEIDFEVSKGDILHLIIIRFNSYSDGLFDEWCVESVHTDLEYAEERAEAIEELATQSECAEERSNDPVVLKAEVVTLPLMKK